MDSGVVQAFAYVFVALASVGGLLWTIYRSRTTQTRQSGRDLIGEMERIISLLKDEVKRKDDALRGQERENEMLRQKNATLLQALSSIYRQPPEVIDWRLNGGPQPPGTRH